MDLRTRRRLLRFRVATAVIGSAWPGSIAGLAVGFALSAGGGWEAADAWRFPLFVLVMSTVFGLPAAALALLVFGLPLAWLLRSVRLPPWSALLAILAGAVIGRFTQHLLDAAFLAGTDTLSHWRLDQTGLLVGGFTGLLWFSLGRGLFAPLPKEAATDGSARDQD